MRTFIQLRDNIGFATVQVPDGESDHTVTPNHTTAIEIFTDNPDQFLNKKYDTALNSWSDAPLITYAIVAEDGSIVEIRNTYFNFDVQGPLFKNNISLNSKWINEEWIEPNFVQEPTQYIESVRIEQASLEAVHPEIENLGDK